MSLERYLGQLFLAWFNQRHDRDFALLPETGPAVGGRPASAQLWASDGQYRLALAVDRLYDSEDAVWSERRLEVEDRLTMDVLTVLADGEVRAALVAPSMPWGG